jgi:hypothetical protein
MFIELPVADLLIFLVIETGEIKHALGNVQ